MNLHFCIHETGFIGSFSPTKSQFFSLSTRHLELKKRVLSADQPFIEKGRRVRNADEADIWVANQNVRFPDAVIQSPSD